MVLDLLLGVIIRALEPQPGVLVVEDLHRIDLLEVLGLLLLGEVLPLCLHLVLELVDFLPLLHRLLLHLAPVPDSELVHLLAQALDLLLVPVDAVVCCPRGSWNQKVGSLRRALAIGSGFGESVAEFHNSHLRLKQGIEHTVRLLHVLHFAAHVDLLQLHHDLLLLIELSVRLDAEFVDGMLQHKHHANHHCDQQQHNAGEKEQEAVVADNIGQRVIVGVENTHRQKPNHNQHEEQGSHILPCFSVRSVEGCEAKQTTDWNQRWPGQRSDDKQHTCRDDDGRVYEVVVHGHNLKSEGVAEVVEGVRVKVEDHESENIENTCTRYYAQTCYVILRVSIDFEVGQHTDDERHQVQHSDVHQGLQNPLFHGHGVVVFESDRPSLVLVLQLLQLHQPLTVEPQNDAHNQIAKEGNRLQEEHHVEVVGEGGRGVAELGEEGRARIVGVVGDGGEQSAAVCHLGEYRLAESQNVVQGLSRAEGVEQIGIHPDDRHQRNLASN